MKHSTAKHNKMRYASSVLCRESLFLVYLCMLLLLLLSHFSCVRLCAIPLTAAHQAPPSLGFSRQETGAGCHFLLQCMKVKSEVAQPCPTLSDPMHCSLPGSSVHGIFQARVLEWGAIAFSNSDARPHQMYDMKKFSHIL